jgi:hypothetical protein
MASWVAMGLSAETELGFLQALWRVVSAMPDDTPIGLMLWAALALCCYFGFKPATLWRLPPGGDRVEVRRSLGPWEWGEDVPVDQIDSVRLVVSRGPLGTREPRPTGLVELRLKPRSWRVIGSSDGDSVERAPEVARKLRTRLGLADDDEEDESHA